MNVLPARTEMLRAFAGSDADYDGLFFTAVKTTGIFCRPSCRARKPLVKNIEFFATAREAIFAGYRPCKRCRPMESNGRDPAWVRPLMQRIDQQPSVRIRDADLRALRIDPARVRRFFLRHHGMTFQAYARGRRLGEAMLQIRRGEKVTNVAIGHGYQSHSGFQSAVKQVFGKAPRAGAAGNCVMTRMIESPVGPLLCGAVDDGICLLEFCDRRAIEAQLTSLRKRLSCAVVPGRHPLLSELDRQLGEYFKGRSRKFDLPLIYPGTDFQRSVWSALLRIPYGTTWSYEQLGRAVGRPQAQRAVGTANGANRIAIIIPCHRVVNKSGKLGGYGGGLWRKEFLLNLERSAG